MEFWEVEQQFAYWRFYPPVGDILAGVYGLKFKNADESAEMSVDDFHKLEPPPGYLSFEALEKIAAKTMLAAK